MVQKTCPVCGKGLTLRQINYSTAVYICDDLKCKYPVGYECIVVERKYEDIGKPSEHLTGKDEDLNDWLDQAIAAPQAAATVASSSSLTSVDEFTCDSGWLDNFMKETVKLCEEKTPAAPSKMNNLVSTEDTDFDDILNFFNGVT